MSVWQFVQDQVLGMRWLNTLINQLLTAVGLDTQSRIGGSVQFFLYDVLKITVLLCLLIFLISYVQSYFPPERSKKIMGRFHGLWANCVAALLGTVTPFCSCSSIPLFIGFTSAGLPLGVTFSFLISSPMVDLGSLVLLMSIFGAKVAVAYVVLGLIVAVAGGTLAAQVSEELPAGCAQPPVGGSVNYTLQPDGTLAEEETPAPTPYYVQFTLTGAPEALTFAGLNLFAVAEDPIDPTAVSGSWINSGGLYDQAAYQVWQGVYAAFHPLALERSPRLTAVSESGFGAPPRRAQISYRWDHAFVLEIDVK